MLSPNRPAKRARACVWSRFSRLRREKPARALPTLHRRAKFTKVDFVDFGRVKPDEAENIYCSIGSILLLYIIIKFIMRSAKLQRAVAIVPYDFRRRGRRRLRAALGFISFCYTRARDRPHQTVGCLRQSAASRPRLIFWHGEDPLTRQLVTRLRARLPIRARAFTKELKMRTTLA